MTYNEDKIKKKYENGRMCTVCNILKEIESFRFSKDKPFRSQCNDCNKLITKIANNHKKQKMDNAYCKKRIKSNKLQIKINKLILMYPNATDVQLAKLINNNINIDIDNLT